MINAGAEYFTHLGKNFMQGVDGDLGNAISCLKQVETDNHIKEEAARGEEGIPNYFDMGKGWEKIVGWETALAYKIAKGDKEYM